MDQEDNFLVVPYSVILFGLRHEIALKVAFKVLEKDEETTRFEITHVSSYVKDSPTQPQANVEHLFTDEYFLTEIVKGIRDCKGQWNNDCEWWLES